MCAKTNANSKILALFTSLWLGVFCVMGIASTIPREAYLYKDSLTREAHYYFGLDAPIPLLAAQIHAESLWNANAVSPVGAQGLTQFMPSTAKWIPEIDSRLKGFDAFNPHMAIRALASYNKWLYKKISAETDLDRWAFTLSAYNGGLGWVNRDKALAKAHGLDSGFYFNSVETVNAGRASWAIKENRAYPQKILFRFQPYYKDWGRYVD